jgi:hypothetical protein
MQNTAGFLLARAIQYSTRGLRTRYSSLRLRPLALPIASTRCSSNFRLPFSKSDGNYDIPFYNDEPVGKQQPCHIQIPSGQKYQEAEAWIDALEPFLPSKLRLAGSTTARNPLTQSSATTGREVSLWLSQSRFSGLDLLSYLSIVSGRWEVAGWIVTVIAEGYKTWDPLPEDARTALSKHWIDPPPPESEVYGWDYAKDNTLLQRLTKTPWQLNPADHKRNTPFNFNHLTFEANPQYLDYKRQKAALGQVWQSLGNMILKAATSSAAEAQRIMPHVLAMIATLHHDDIIPESVYSYTSTQSVSALQQPPTLHLLSSRILTALSDAAWNAHEESAAAAVDYSKPKQSFLRRELPGTRYKTPIEDLRPEIWLDLVLWSCLHGGWVIEGANVLERMQEYSGSVSWSLICWREVTERQDSIYNEDSSALWTKVIDVMEGTRAHTPRSPLEQKQIERTVSSEVIAAYVDGLINVIHVGVGKRGVPIETVLAHVIRFKAFLEENNLGLGYTSWAAIIQRFVESGGIEVDKNPALMQTILSLAQPFGKELEATNASSDENINHPTPGYVFDANATSVGLHHRVMQAYIDVGGVEGALGTFQTLQQYTDLNQRRSMEKFFHELKHQRPPNITTETIFTSPAALPADEFPEFFPKVPAHVLGPLLDLLTEARVYNFQKWLVYSQDLDGPIIPSSLYSEPGIAPALIRFATISQQKELLAEILKLQSSLTQGGALRLPRRVLSALLETQIQRRRWDHVDKILSMTSKYKDSRVFHPGIAASLAKQILLLQSTIVTHDNKHSESLRRATEIFKMLLQGEYGNSTTSWASFHHEDAMHALLAVLSTISPDWASFCAGLSPKSGNQPLDLPIKIFNAVLEGVVELSGVEGGRRLWETWCRDVSHVAAFFGAKTPVVPPNFISRANEYFNAENRVSLDDLPGGPLQFQGRLVPDFSTLRIIVSKLMFDDDLGVSDRQASPNTPQCTREDMVEWCLIHFQAFGLREQEAEKNIKRLQAIVQWQRMGALENDSTIQF